VRPSDQEEGDSKDTSAALHSLGHSACWLELCRGGAEILLGSKTERVRFEEKKSNGEPLSQLDLSTAKGAARSIPRNRRTSHLNGGTGRAACKDRANPARIRGWIYPSSGLMGKG